MHSFIQDCTLSLVFVSRKCCRKKTKVRSSWPGKKTWKPFFPSFPFGLHGRKIILLQSTKIIPLKERFDNRENLSQLIECGKDEFTVKNVCTVPSTTCDNYKLLSTRKRHSRPSLLPENDSPCLTFIIWRNVDHAIEKKKISQKKGFSQTAMIINCWKIVKISYVMQGLPWVAV